DGGQAESLELGGGRATTRAELEAPLAEMVEHRDAFRDAGRVVHWRRGVVDRRPHVDALRAGGDVGQEDRGGRDVGVLLEPVRLDGPDVLPPAPVTRTGQLELAQQPLVLGAPGIGGYLVLRDVGLDEETKFHTPRRL